MKIFKVTAITVLIAALSACGGGSSENSPEEVPVAEGGGCVPSNSLCAVGLECAPVAVGVDAGICQRPVVDPGPDPEPGPDPVGQAEACIVSNSLCTEGLSCLPKSIGSDEGYCLVASTPVISGDPAERNCASLKFNNENKNEQPVAMAKSSDGLYVAYNRKDGDLDSLVVTLLKATLQPDANFGGLGAAYVLLNATPEALTYVSGDGIVNHRLFAGISFKNENGSQLHLIRINDEGTRTTSLGEIPDQGLLGGRLILDIPDGTETATIRQMSYDRANNAIYVLGHYKLPGDALDNQVSFIAKVDLDTRQIDPNFADNGYIRIPETTLFAQKSLILDGSIRVGLNRLLDEKIVPTLFSYKIDNGQSILELERLSTNSVGLAIDEGLALLDGNQKYFVANASSEGEATVFIKPILDSQETFFGAPDAWAGSVLDRSIDIVASDPVTGQLFLGQDMEAIKAKNTIHFLSEYALPDASFGTLDGVLSFRAVAGDENLAQRFQLKDMQILGENALGVLIQTPDSDILDDVKVSDAVICLIR